MREFVKTARETNQAIVSGIAQGDAPGRFSLYQEGKSWVLTKGEACES